MADMSDYLEQSSYDFWFRPGETAPTRPTSHTISLWSEVTGDEEGAGTELASGTSPGYARASVTFSAPVEGVGSNSNLVEWATATGDWVAATHYGIHDHLGNLLQRLKPLPNTIRITTGNKASAQPGDLQITFD